MSERVREGRKAGEKTAGLEPIRTGEAPSTCTARPSGESPSDKMRDHHHYHYLFAKQRPTLGPILIGFANYIEHFAFGAGRMLKKQGRVNGWIKANTHLETSAANATGLC